MALIRCKECGKEVAETALTCPYCGVKVSNGHTRNANRILVGICIAIAVICVIAIIVILGIAEKGTSSNGNTNQSSTPVGSTNSQLTVTPDTPQFTIYPAGMYKVGSDMPSGEYVLFDENSFTGSSYFEINSDSSGTFSSIIANDNFSNNSIVTVNDGEYLTMHSCYAIPISEDPSVDTSGEGMYKIGVHLPAGEYKVTVSDSSGHGYIEVDSDSRHVFGSIIANDIFEGSRYITVEEEQYLKLSNCVFKFE